MNDFNFGDVLTKAWQIIWKHKVLWIFGILAGCGTNRANASINYNLGRNSSYRQDSSQLPPELLRRLEQLQEFFNGVNWTTVAIVILSVVCIIMLIAIFLSTIGRIGLIRGAAQADAGREQLAFAELWSESLPYFWRVFWLNFLSAFPFFIIAIGAVLAVVFSFIAMAGTAQQTGFNRIFLGLIPLVGGVAVLFCCISLLSIVIQFIVNQAYNAIVLEERGLIEGFMRGWDVIVKNIGPMLLMGVILYIIQLVLSFVLAIPTILILLPFIVGAFAAGSGAGSISAMPIMLGILCVCLYAPIAWIIAGILEAYIQSAWTLTFLRVTVQPQAPTPMQVPDASSSL